MTTLQYALMLIGFALWFWAGYTVGKNRNFIKQHKDFLSDKKKEWNYYIDSILSESKDNEDAVNYINQHFKKL